MLCLPLHLTVAAELGFGNFVSLCSFDQLCLQCEAWQMLIMQKRLFPLRSGFSYRFSLFSGSDTAFFTWQSCTDLKSRSIYGVLLKTSDSGVQLRPSPPASQSLLMATACLVQTARRCLGKSERSVEGHRSPSAITFFAIILINPGKSCEYT